MDFGLDTLYSLRVMVAVVAIDDVKYTRLLAEVCAPVGFLKRRLHSELTWLRNL